MMQEWKAQAAALGDALVNPGMPVGMTKVLDKSGVSDEQSPYPISGFSIIEAESMDSALELLKDCPHLHLINGTLEVSKMMQMGG